jgi:hypothetical protein
MLEGIIAAIYYLLAAVVAVIMLRNLVRERSWERELLYVIVLVPFLLRLLRLK